MEKSKKGKYQHKEAYLTAAMALIREQGIERLTMRSVAQRMEVSPMAIYKHFASKELLLQALLEQFIERANVLPEEDLVWQDWVRHVARQMVAALQVEPLWLTLLGSMNVGDNALAVTQAFLVKLTTAGFSIQHAIEAYIVTLQLVMGAVVLDAAISQRQAMLSQRLQDLPGMPEPLPRNLLARPALENGLDLLLAGLERKLAITQS